MLGVDASRDGWVAVAPDQDRPRVYTGATLTAVIAAAGRDGAVEIVGVDIPIGLPDQGPRQAFGLRVKVLEVDGFRRAGGRAVLEVHPELSFAAMAGAPLASSKKTWAGAAARYRLLTEHGIALPTDLGPDPGRAGVDDVLDAAAAAWTARRVQSGDAFSLPDPPEPLPDGVSCAIWV